MASLFGQFEYVIEKNFSQGMNKHSLKKSGYEGVMIASFSYRKGIIKFSHNFCTVIKRNHPEVKDIKNIKNEYVVEFFKEKEEKGVTHTTLIKYKSYLSTLDKCIRKTMHFRTHFGTAVETVGGVEKIRTVYMRQEHIDAVLEHLREHSKSKVLLGLEVANLYGLRVSEVCKLKGKDFDIPNMTLHIVDSKGKKNRDLSIDTQEKYDQAVYIKSIIAYNDRVCAVREIYANQVLRDTLLLLGIEDYKGLSVGFHGIRKKVAKEVYIKTGDIKEVSVHLGHEENRKEVSYSYVNAK